MNYTFHQCSGCCNLERVPNDTGYVCPKTGRELDWKEANKPTLCKHYQSKVLRDLED